MPLTFAQSMMLRVALESFRAKLTGEIGKSLGEIGPLYQARATEVSLLLYLNQPPSRVNTL